MQIGALEIELLANIARLQRDMDMAKRSVGDAMSSIDNFVSKAQRTLGAFGIGIGAISFGSLIKGAVDAADKINDVAKANEVAVGSVLKLSQALKLNGGEAESSGKLFSSLTSKIDEAVSGSAKAQAQFKAVGVTLNDLRTLDGQKLFEKTLQGLGSIEDPIKRNAAAMDMLGKAAKGVDISGLANDYASNQQSFDDAEKSFRDIGIAMDKLDDFTQKTSESLATSFGPILRSIVETVDDAVFGFSKLEENIRKARQAKDGFTGKWAPAAGMSDKPVIGQFNLPAEYQSGATRDVIDAEASAREKALQDKKERSIKEAKAAREKLNAELLKDIQQQVDFEENQKEALNASELKAMKELADKKERQRKEFADLDEKYNKITRDAENRALDEKYKKAKEYQDKLAKEQQAMWNIIESTAHDTWNKVWRGGSDAFKNIGKTIKSAILDLLYQMTIKKWILNIGMVGSAGASGIASAADVVGNGAIGSGSGSIFGTISDGLSSLNSNVVGSIEKLGTFLSTGNGGLGDTIGGFLGQNASTIASALSFAPAALSLLKGDFKSAAFQGAGAALGTAFGGPVGGAIGSFLGGALGGLFGGKKAPRFDSNVRGSFNASTKDYTTAQGMVMYKRLGADTQMGGLGEAFSKSLDAILSGFGIGTNITTNNRLVQKRKSSYGMFDASFDGALVSAGIKGSAKNTQDTYNKLVEQVLGTTLVQAIQASKLVDGIKQLFSGITDKTQVANMINASLALNDAQQALASRFGLTVDQAGKVSVATGLAGDELAKFVTLLAQSASVYQTIGDVLIKAKSSLTAGLGGNLPATLKDFDNVLKGIDKTTQAGIESFGAMFSLREQFSAFTNSVDSLKGNVRNALYSMVSDSEKFAMQQADMAKVFSELGYAVPASMQDLIALGKSIDFTTASGLNLASVFPTLVASFQETQSTIDGLTSSLDALNTSNFKTLVDYQRAQAYVINGIPMSQLPSYDIGTPFVQGDQVAQIHHGERIVTASDNKNLSESNVILISEVKAMRAESQAQQLAMVQATQKMAKILDKIDNNGIVLSEVDNSGVRVVLDTRTVA